ncbi:MAG: hypothetical protein GY940_10320 [bacterium]|nr:hypothetical protein [bacterium]
MAYRELVSQGAASRRNRTATQSDGTTGYNQVWYMNGTQRTGIGNVPSVLNTDWKIVGVYDSNKDGNVDIMWRLSTTGRNWVWYMNNNTRLGTANLTAFSDLNWDAVN